MWKSVLFLLIVKLLLKWSSFTYLLIRIQCPQCTSFLGLVLESFLDNVGNISGFSGILDCSPIMSGTSRVLSDSDGRPTEAIEDLVYLARSFTVVEYCWSRCFLVTPQGESRWTYVSKDNSYFELSKNVLINWHSEVSRGSSTVRGFLYGYFCRLLIDRTQDTMSRHTCRYHLARKQRRLTSTFSDLFTLPSWF